MFFDNEPNFGRGEFILHGVLKTLTVLIHSNPMGRKNANITCMHLLVFRTPSGGAVVSSSNCVDYPIQYGGRDAAVCTPRSPKPAYARHATDRIPRTATLCALLQEKRPRPHTDVCTAQTAPDHRSRIRAITRGQRPGTILGLAVDS